MEYAELLKTLGGPLLIALLGWVVGTRVSALWAYRQKRKELELATAQRFYEHYGEFFAVWKLWNHYRDTLSADSEQMPLRRDELLDRATRNEGGLEAVLLKVAAERTLTSDLREDFGMLRQAFQTLRECIRDQEVVQFGGAEAPQYLEFKRVAAGVGTILAAREAGASPSRQEAFAAFREITSNKHEGRWRALAE